MSTGNVASDLIRALSKIPAFRDGMENGMHGLSVCFYVDYVLKSYFGYIG